MASAELSVNCVSVSVSSDICEDTSDALSVVCEDVSDILFVVCAESSVV